MAMNRQARACGHDLRISVLGIRSAAVQARFAAEQLNWQQHTAETSAACDELQRELKCWQPDLVHFHFVGPCSRLIEVCARQQIRCVMTDHASDAEPVDWHPLVQRLRRWRRKRYGRMVDLHLGVSDFVCRRLRRNHSGRCIERLYNGVDLQRFAAPGKPASASLQQRIGGRFVLGFVGQLSHDKGLDFALELMQALDPQQFCLLVVGSGPMADVLAQQAHPGVLVLGACEDIAGIMAQMNLLLVPSRWDEAFGLVAAEAAACGVPSLVHAVGGLPEVVSDQHSGYVLPSLSEQSWLQCIRELAAQPARCRQMGQAARQRAEQQFSLERQVTASWQHYAELVAA